MKSLFLVSLILVTTFAPTQAQPANTYPVLTQGDGLVCGASLSLHGVAAQQVTQEAMMSAHPVINLAFDQAGTNAIRSMATGIQAMVSRYVYKGDWIDNDGKQQHVLCTFVEAGMAHPILEASMVTH